MLRIGDLVSALVWALVGFAASGALAASAAQAQRADRSYGRREPLLPLRVDAHVPLTWEGALGLGGRADLLLVNGTFRYSARDELALSVGGDVTFITTQGSTQVDLYPTVVLQWTLGVSERFAFFPELGLVARIEDFAWKRVDPNVGFGARYYLHRSLGLQGRLGWPIALSAGVVF